MPEFDVQRNAQGDVSMVEPESGSTYWVPEKKVQEALSAGFSPEAPAAYADRQERKSLQNPLLGIGLGVLSGGTAGIAPALLAQMSPEFAHKAQLIREEQPLTTGVADFASTIGGAFVGGPVALLSRMGTGVARKTAASLGGKALAQTAGKLTGFAAEGAAFSALKGYEDLAIAQKPVLSEEGVDHLVKAGTVGGWSALLLGGGGMALTSVAGKVGRGAVKLLNKGGESQVAKATRTAERLGSKLKAFDEEAAAATEIATKMDDAITTKASQMQAIDAELTAMQAQHGEAVGAYSAYKRLDREIDDILGPWGFKQKEGGFERGLQERFRGKSGMGMSDEAKALRRMRQSLEEGTTDSGIELTGEMASRYRAKVAQYEGALKADLKRAEFMVAQKSQLQKGFGEVDPRIVSKIDELSAKKGALADDIAQSTQSRLDQTKFLDEIAIKKETMLPQFEAAQQAIKLEQAGAIGRAVGMLSRVAVRMRGGGMAFGGGVMVGGGGPMGMIAAMIAPNAGEALAKYAARIVTSPKGQAFSQRLSRAVGQITRPEIPSAIRANVSAIMSDEDFRSVRQEVEAFNPQLWMESAQMAAEQTGKGPETAELAGRVLRSMEYLKKNLTRPPDSESERLTSEPWAPSTAAKLADQARIEGAVNPDQAIAALVTETFRPEHREALEAVHPDILQMMQRHMGDAVEERKARGKDLPLETARQYAVLMGDHRLLPRLYDADNIERIQGLYRSQREQAQRGQMSRAAPQFSEKNMTSIQRALEGRA